MTFKLEALSPAEGIGIVRAGQDLWLVRPPYSLRDSPVLNPEALKDAIFKYGYFASAEQFPAWQDVIDFLNRQAAQFRKDLGKEIPESIAGSDILEVAPPEVLTSFLDRVEAELIPQRAFDHADNFLLALLGSSVLSRYPAIGNRAARLLQRSKQARANAESAVTAPSRRDVRFESLPADTVRVLWQIVALWQIARAVPSTRSGGDPPRGEFEGKGGIQLIYNDPAQQALPSINPPPMENLPV